MIKLVTADALGDHVGEEIGVSEWTEITQQQVDQFAESTMDHQFIHVDPEAAALTSFGGTIAHGFLTLSLLSHFAMNGCGISVEGTTMFINYGLENVRFVLPVRVGKRVRARARLLSADQKQPGRFLFRQEVKVEVEGEKRPALIAEWLTMAVCRQL